MAALAQSPDGSDRLPVPPWEQGDGWDSSDYESGIRFYESLAEISPMVSIRTMGRTDSGLPLHLVLISADGEFDISRNRALGRSVLLINNAIHPTQ